MKKLFALAMLALPVWLGTQNGCGPSCYPSERVVSTGIRYTAGAQRVYMTSGPEGPFLPFEGGTVLRLRHQLGTNRLLVQVKLSFSEHPLASGGGGSSFAAGNQAVVQREDADEVVVKNDSCANYYIRVLVEGDIADGDGGVVDAETGAGDTGVADAADGG